MAGTTHEQIAAPAVKAASAIGTAVIASAANIDPATFLPHDLGGWCAATASVLAAFYSLLLISEWFYKRLWRPFFVWLGWLEPRPEPVLIVREEG